MSGDGSGLGLAEAERENLRGAEKPCQSHENNISKLQQLPMLPHGPSKNMAAASLLPFKIKIPHGPC